MKKSEFLYYMFINGVNTGTQKKWYLSYVISYMILHCIAIKNSLKIGFLYHYTPTLKWLTNICGSYW